jgi:hypothetical protein
MVQSHEGALAYSYGGCGGWVSALSVKGLSKNKSWTLQGKSPRSKHDFVPEHRQGRDPSTSTSSVAVSKCTLMTQHHRCDGVPSSGNCGRQGHIS